MADCESGVCDICHKESKSLSREYYRYGFPCECHGSEHVELVRYCPNCEPHEPTYTKVRLATEVAEELGEIWKEKHYEQKFNPRNRQDVGCKDR